MTVIHRSQALGAARIVGLVGVRSAERTHGKTVLARQAAVEVERTVHFRGMGWASSSLTGEKWGTEHRRNWSAASKDRARCGRSKDFASRCEIGVSQKHLMAVTAVGAAAAADSDDMLVAVSAEIA